MAKGADMRVLISAYACEPNKGSEPEVGLRAVLAAANRHQVWVITRENNLPALNRFLAAHPLGSKIEVIGLDLAQPTLRFKRLGGFAGVNLYYELWQRKLRELAIGLDLEHDFDLVHHVTFARYWSSAGVSAVAKPFVWGPLGGGSRPPLMLLPTMGVRGCAEDLARVMARPLIARLSGVGSTARRASMIIAQNPETRRAMRHQEKTVVLPNALLVADSVEHSKLGASPPSFVSVGRLIPLKGHALAIAAMTHLDGRTLDIYGDGPDRDRLEGLARRHGVADRIHFRGHTSREEVLSAVGNADALVHAALHDEAPLAIVEALASGTPVVCLDRGGPPVIVGHWPRVPSRAVRAASPTVTAGRIAVALEEVAGKRTAPDPTPADWVSGELLDIYDRVAGSTGDR